MADDWQVGDLAVCVDVTPPTHLRRAEGYALVAALEPGRSYRAHEVRLCKRGIYLCLKLEGFDYSTGGGGEYAGHAASRFRKIRPDAHEACEDEFVTLLKRSRVVA